MAARRPSAERPTMKKAVWSVFSPIHLDYIHSELSSVPPLCYYRGAKDATSDEEFDSIVEGVKEALSSDIHPKMISQGSSGSYFCYKKVAGNAEDVPPPLPQVCGVFKPKNEEPYGHLNPKWTKWIHRNLCPCFFGRSCIIPNLGYISESAASVLDQALKLYIVPKTKVVELSSKSFYYSYIDKHASERSSNPKPLPPKLGSFQLFLHGYKNADVFLARYPYELQRYGNVAAVARSAVSEDNRGLARVRSLSASMSASNTSPKPCDHTALQNDGVQKAVSSPQIFSENSSIRTSASRRSAATLLSGLESDTNGFSWTPDTRQQFQLELEKLIVLDYLMRNTDRGADNWMVSICHSQECPESRLDFLACGTHQTGYHGFENEFGYLRPIVSRRETDPHPHPSASSSKNSISLPIHLHIAAIDNGLAFPYKHPDEWRSYPYGWQYLPPSIINKPFSKSIRSYILPMICDPSWWEQTVASLRSVFIQDPDFNERMFNSQMGILKAQGLNLAYALLTPGYGPLDLCGSPWLKVEEVEVKSGMPESLSTMLDPSLSNSVAPYRPYSLLHDDITRLYNHNPNYLVARPGIRKARSISNYGACTIKPHEIIDEDAQRGVSDQANNQEQQQQQQQERASIPDAAAMYGIGWSSDNTEAQPLLTAPGHHSSVPIYRGLSLPSPGQDQLHTALVGSTSGLRHLNHPSTAAGEDTSNSFSVFWERMKSGIKPQRHRANNDRPLVATLVVERVKIVDDTKPFFSCC
ncbi:Phosphatidylinositol 4-kinase [Mycoemilia scoparia]|uniref:Phosphatidylinositol 4-kinase n=1 Tax=Mycoemilia scoparia TaxID=417184 RepID=A0A9W8A1H1_9FUNG|nr:Phosphatidylinositol 4-kinase [Mycoemilia scoparia]